MLFAIGFGAALLLPVLLISGVVLGVYIMLLLFLYRWSKAVFGVVFVVSLIALGTYIVVARNQYKEKGYICWGENLCIDDGRGSHPERQGASF